MTIPSCALDARGMREQRARQERLAPSVTGVTQRPTALLIDFASGFDRRALDEMIEVERQCCPFFRLEFDDQARRLSVAVDDPEHAAALEVLAAALAAPAAPR